MFSFSSWRGLAQVCRKIPEGSARLSTAKHSRESSWPLGRNRTLRHSVAMNESGRSARLRLTADPEVPGRRSAGRFVRLSQLRKWRDCEQVAAVCYRRRGGNIEFLLVRTRGGERWTFPKGSAERGLSQAQAAALEAFEEAGVHGRIEENAFARYILRKREEGGSRGLEKSEIQTNAYLCEVSRLSSPQESGRNRTWFSAEDARSQLRAEREKYDGAQLARVIERALARIRTSDEGLCAGSQPRVSQRFDLSRLKLSHADALRKVKFDFAEAYGPAEKSLIPYSGSRLTTARQPSSRLLGPGACEPSQCEVLQFGPSRRKTPKALGSGNL
jgi:8-oxo-dGTP pyrophosphatase MutT (NUDIX family)